MPSLCELLLLKDAYPNLPALDIIVDQARLANFRARESDIRRTTDEEILVAKQAMYREFIREFPHLAKPAVMLLLDSLYSFKYVLEVIRTETPPLVTDIPRYLASITRASYQRDGQTEVIKAIGQFWRAEISQLTLTPKMATYNMEWTWAAACPLLQAGIKLPPVDELAMVLKQVPRVHDRNPDCFDHKFCEDCIREYDSWIDGLCHHGFDLESTSATGQTLVHLLVHDLVDTNSMSTNRAAMPMLVACLRNGADLGTASTAELFKLTMPQLEELAAAMNLALTLKRNKGLVMPADQTPLSTNLNLA